MRYDAALNRPPCAKCGALTSMIMTAQHYRPHDIQGGCAPHLRRPGHGDPVFEVVCQSCHFKVAGETLEEAVNLWRFEGLDHSDMKEPCGRCLDSYVEILAFPKMCPACNDDGGFLGGEDCSRCDNTGTIDRGECERCKLLDMDSVLAADFS